MNKPVWTYDSHTHDLLKDGERVGGFIGYHEDLLRDLNGPTTPSPDTLAPGHNPDKLTLKQVEPEKGWRLLDRDEIKDRQRFVPGLQNWEVWSEWSGGSSTGYLGSLSTGTYRTKLSRSELAALDNPPAPPSPPKLRRVPLGPTDFPPGTVVRFLHQNPASWQSVIRVTPHELFLANGNSLAFEGGLTSHPVIGVHTNGIVRSLDQGKTWLPCYKEVPTDDEDTNK